MHVMYQVSIIIGSFFFIFFSKNVLFPSDSVVGFSLCSSHHPVNRNIFRNF